MTGGAFRFGAGEATVFGGSGFGGSGFGGGGGGGGVGFTISTFGFGGGGGGGVGFGVGLAAGAGSFLLSTTGGGDLRGADLMTSTAERRGAWGISKNDS